LRVVPIYPSDVRPLPFSDEATVQMEGLRPLTREHFQGLMGRQGHRAVGMEFLQEGGELGRLQHIQVIVGGTAISPRAIFTPLSRHLE